MTREYVVFSRFQYSVVKKASIKNNIICIFLFLDILFLPKQTVTSPEPDTYWRLLMLFISVEVDDDVDSI